MSLLGEEFPKTQARLRRILGHEKEEEIEKYLRRVSKATFEEDLAEIIKIYREMEKIENERG